MSQTIEMNTNEILRKFDSLNMKNQKKAAKQAIRISLNVLIKQAKKNLQKSLKVESPNRQQREGLRG